MVEKVFFFLTWYILDRTEASKTGPNYPFIKLPSLFLTCKFKNATNNGVVN